MILKDVCAFMFLNGLVAILISFVVYVKVTHFVCFFGGGFCSCGLVCVFYGVYDI
jgi:hypothetical protein